MTATAAAPSTAAATSADGSARAHAVVLGGSMAGLLAARVLTDHYERVTVVDRDAFPTRPAHRKGVPQSRHAHALLPRGAQIMGELFPSQAHPPAGFAGPSLFEDLIADGAFVGDAGATLRMVTPAGALPAEPDGQTFIGASRFLLEWHVRRRLAAFANVTLVEHREVTRLLADRGRVVGVRLRARGAASDGGAAADGGAAVEDLPADLVVDATGRGSKAPTWLAELGYGTVPEERIDSGIGYATRWFARPDDWDEPWEATVINGRVPDNPRAGLVLPVEDGTWTITLGGFADNHPPLDEEGFAAFAADLADPGVAKAIAAARPLSPIQGARTPTNRLRRFERLARWPVGFIVTGDAVCAFNPIYGQGMTVAAMDAAVLDRQLRSTRPDFERRFRRALAAEVAGVWSIASGEDLRWGVSSSGIKPRRGGRALQWYVDRVLRRATVDPVVADAWGDVIGLVRKPASLLRPAVAVRALALR